VYVLAVIIARQYASAACLSSGNQDTINNALSSGGAGTIVQLCAGVTIQITGTISFTAENQEVSTESYPTGSTRATLSVASSDTIVNTAVLRGW
jgi:hypothetical protein